MRCNVKSGGAMLGVMAAVIALFLVGFLFPSLLHSLHVCIRVRVCVCVCVCVSVCALAYVRFTEKHYVKRCRKSNCSSYIYKDQSSLDLILTVLPLISFFTHRIKPDICCLCSVIQATMCHHEREK